VVLKNLVNIMAQYTTGKINNPNSSVQVQTVPGSKGVMVGLNTPITVQTTAKGRVGGTSSAPKSAEPTR
jgi:hypothetical protein